MEQSFATRLLASVFVVGLALGACTSSNGQNPLGSSGNGNGGGGSGNNGPTATPTNTPTPLPTYNLYKNGVYGTWFGQAMITTQSDNGTVNNVGAVDPFTGDTTALQLNVPCDPSVPGCTTYTKTHWLKFLACPSAAVSNLPGTCPGAQSTAFYESHGGKLSFDLRIDIPMTSLDNVYVYYGGDAQCVRSHVVANGLLSTGNFAHVVIPMNTMQVSCPIPSLTDDAFYIAAQRVTATAIASVFTVNDVKWTP